LFFNPQTNDQREILEALASSGVLDIDMEVPQYYVRRAQLRALGWGYEEIYNYLLADAMIPPRQRTGVR
jgi:hypothetical protein